MGLAASQGRYLLLGVRKNDVEGRLMSIANQKLSLARKSSNLSEAYSNALNSTTKSLNTSVSYAQFMNPGSVDSSGYQYVFTDANNNGRVILSSALATTFGLEGSSGASGKLPTGVAGMAPILAGAANLDEAKVLAYLNSQGTDGASGTTQGAAFFNFNTAGSTLVDVIKDANLFSTYSNHNYADLGGSYAGLSDFDPKTIVTNLSSKIAQVSAQLSGPLARAMGISTTEVDKYLTIAAGATLLQFTNGKGEGMSFGNGTEANHGDVYYSDTSSLDGANADNRYQYAAKWLNGITFVEKGATDGRIVIDMTEVIETLLNYFQLAYGLRNAEDKSKVASGQLLYNACNVNGGMTVGGQNMYALGACFRAPGSTRCQVNTNDFYVDGINFNSGGDRTRTHTTLMNFGASSSGSSSSSGPRPGPGETGSTGSTDSSGLNNAQASLLNWYLNLYNAINNYGWTVRSDVSNATTLQNGILNGSINLQQIGSGGLLANASNDLINEEEDEEAIERAQAEYEAGKDKLDYKESMLDLQQHNLDTELSSINTEIDSVKKIIDNNIKTFKMFDA